MTDSPDHPAEPAAPGAPSAPGAPTEAAVAERPRAVRQIVEWVAVIVGALVIALLVKTFLLQAFYIPSSSMEPTLKIGDRVLVNKLSYHLHDIHQGDIVVFERPPGVAESAAIKDLIKRVIALPGQTIESRNGTVYVNGKALQESYLPAGTTTTNLPVQKVPAHRIFVMGDNRGNSRDSRFFGPIEENLVVGRAFVRVWPISHFGLL